MLVHARAWAEAVPDVHGEQADPLAAHGAAIEAAGEAGHVVDPHAAAEAAAHGGGGVGLPQFDPSSFASQVFWLAVAFSFLYLFFSKKTLPDIGGVIGKRETHIRSTLEAAKQQKDLAEGLRSDYEQRMENARTEAQNAFAAMEKSVKDKSDAQYKAFQERAGAETAATEKEIEKAKAAAMEDMQHLAAEIASKAAEKIIGIETDLDQAKTVVRSLKAKAA